MTFDEYEKLSAGTAFYPQRGTGHKDALSYTALALCGESGEYAEKIKKYLRDGVFDPVLAIKELGDVLWYLSAASRELGVTLETVAQINIEKLKQRREKGTLSGNGDSR
jgi:NTP pyrophosphatase (non-canonical NTP hydrolase)